MGADRPADGADQQPGGYPRGYPTAVTAFGFAQLAGQYAKMAETLGGYGERVEKPGRRGARPWAGVEDRDGAGPALLEIMTRPETVISRSVRRGQGGRMGERPGRVG